MRKYLVLLNMVNASTRGVDSSPAKKLLNNHNSRNQTITRAVESPEPKKMENHELDKTDKAHGRLFQHCF